MDKKRKKQNRQKKKKDNLSKFQGNNKIKVFKKFLHMGLCDIKRERVDNWHKVFKYGNAQIEQFGQKGSLNMYDKTIFLGVLKLAQDKEKESSIKKIIQTKINKSTEVEYDERQIVSNPTPEQKELIERKGKADEIKEHKSGSGVSDIHLFYTFNIKFNKFCDKYTQTGRRHKENVLHSIERLWATRILHKEFDSSGKIIEETPYYYIVDFRLNKDGIMTFTLSNMLMESCKKGLLISYDFFLSLKTEIAKALYLFFSGTKNNTFAYKTLKDALSLSDEDFKNRELIKQGLNFLKESKFIKDFKIENREIGIFYILTYDILNNDNKIAYLTDVAPSEPAILSDGDKRVPDGEVRSKIV